jgi:hypothetical protein
VLVQTDSYRDTALGVYGAVGFKLKENVLIYRKDYPL